MPPRTLILVPISLGYACCFLNGGLYVQLDLVDHRMAAVAKKLNRDCSLSEEVNEAIEIEE